jgi:hypothetical protein
MMSINATDLDRKSVGAQWRDLCVDALSWNCLEGPQGSFASMCQQGAVLALSSGRYGVKGGNKPYIPIEQKKVLDILAAPFFPKA